MIWITPEVLGEQRSFALPCQAAEREDAGLQALLILSSANPLALPLAPVFFLQDVVFLQDHPFHRWLHSCGFSCRHLCVLPKQKDDSGP